MSHRNGSLTEISLADQGIDQYRLSGFGRLPGFFKDTIDIFFLVQNKTLAAVSFGHPMVIGPSQHRGHIITENGRLVPGDLGPAGIIADQGDHRDIVARKCVKLLQAETCRPIAVNQPDFGLRMSQFGPKGKSGAYTEGAESTRIQPCQRSPGLQNIGRRAELW